MSTNASTWRNQSCTRIFLWHVFSNMFLRISMTRFVFKIPIYKEKSGCHFEKFILNWAKKRDWKQAIIVSSNRGTGREGGARRRDDSAKNVKKWQKGFFLQNWPQNLLTHSLTITTDKKCKAVFWNQNGKNSLRRTKNWKIFKKLSLA